MDLFIKRKDDFIVPTVKGELGPTEDGYTIYKIIGVPQGYSPVAAAKQALKACKKSPYYVVDWADVEKEDVVVEQSKAKAGSKVRGRTPKVLVTWRVDKRVVDAIKEKSDREDIARIDIVEAALKAYLKLK